MALWFIFALTSVFALALSELSQKRSLTTSDNISVSTNNFLVWGMQGLFGLLVVALLHIPITLNLSPLDWLRLIILAFIYFTASIFYYRSFKTESASLSATIASFSVVVSTILGVIFFQETSSLIKFLGILSIILAIAIAHYETNRTLQKAHLFALIGGLMYGVAYTLDKSFSLQINPHLYVILICWSCSIAGLIISPTIIAKEIGTISKNTFKSMVTSALGGLGFNTFTFLAYSVGGEVGTIDALNNSNIFLVILAEVLIFKDRSKLLKKVLGATFALIGIILLYQHI